MFWQTPSFPSPTVPNQTPDSISDPVLDSHEINFNAEYPVVDQPALPPGYLTNIGTSFVGGATTGVAKTLKKVSDAIKSVVVKAVPAANSPKMNESFWEAKVVGIPTPLALLAVAGGVVYWKKRKKR